MSAARAAAGEPAELGRRLREGDRGAAPPALNLIEDRSRAGRERARELLAEVAPAALGAEAPAHLVGVIARLLGGDLGGGHLLAALAQRPLQLGLLSGARA